MIDYPALKCQAAVCGILINDIAAMTGYTRQGLHKAIKKGTLSINAYLETCRALNVPIGTFLRWDNTEELNRIKCGVETIQNRLKHMEHMTGQTPQPKKVRHKMKQNP